MGHYRSGLIGRTLNAMCQCTRHDRTLNTISRSMLPIHFCMKFVRSAR